jgi:hypothetical protein
MNAGRLLPFFEVAPSVQPVTDNLSLWLDGSDGIFDTSYNRLETNAESNTFYLYDRASETYRLYQIIATANRYLYGRHKGSGIIEYVKRNSSTSIGGLTMTGNIPNIRTIEVTIALDTSVMSGLTNRCRLLTDGTNKSGWAAGSGGVFAPSAFNNTGVATTPLVDTAMHHYLVTIGDDLTRYLYKDGLLVSTSTEGYRVPVFNTTTVISTFMTTGSAPIGSVMVRLASIRMYTDVLTADEIAQNYSYELSTGRLS